MGARVGGRPTNDALDAWGELAPAVEPEIRVYLRWTWTGLQSDHDDVVSETKERLLEAAAQYRGGDTGSFARGITRNVAREFLRMPLLEPLPGDGTGSSPIAGSQCEAHLERLLESAIEQLSRAQRTGISWFWMGRPTRNMSEDECRVLEIGRSGEDLTTREHARMRKRLERAIEALRKIIRVDPCYEPLRGHLLPEASGPGAGTDE